MVVAARKLTLISEATAHVKILTGGRMVAAAPKLTFISEAAAYVKILTGGRMVAVARNLPVFFRWAPIDICCQSCEATQPGEKDCYGSQPPSLYPTGTARHPLPVV